MKFAKSFLAAGLILSLAVVWTNCHKDSLQRSEGLGTQFLFSSKDGLKMSYEVETMSLEAPVVASDAAKLTVGEQILAEPKIRRESVQSNLLADGTSSLCILRLEPKNPYRKPSNSLPDDSPKVVKTLISNGNASNYDADGKLVSNNQMPSENLKGLADLFKNITIDPKTIAVFVNAARERGLIVFEKNNIVGIKFLLEQGGYLINVYDFNRNLQLSSEVHTADGKLKTRHIFFIDGDYKAPILRGIHEQRFFKSEVSNIDMVSNVYQQIDDFQMVNNLN